MTDTFFISDTHFLHKSILSFCPNTRRGSDHIEMTELMIEAWNSKIKPNDTVYHLGDVSFGRAEETDAVLKRLNGTIHLIQGNHDKEVINNHVAKRWASVQPYLRKTINGQLIIMFHYPIVEWDAMHYGSWHLFGHVHGKDMGLSDRKAFDVGIDNRSCNTMTPWSFEELKEILDERSIIKHH